MQAQSLIQHALVEELQNTYMGWQYKATTNMNHQATTNGECNQYLGPMTM
jgi:hypothetical protein